MLEYDFSSAINHIFELESAVTGIMGRRRGYTNDRVNILNFHQELMMKNQLESAIKVSLSTNASEPTNLM